MDEDVNSMRHDIQEHLSAVIIEQMVVGEVGLWQHQMKMLMGVV